MDCQYCLKPIPDHFLFRPHVPLFQPHWHSFLYVVPNNMLSFCFFHPLLLSSYPPTVANRFSTVLHPKLWSILHFPCFQTCTCSNRLLHTRFRFFAMEAFLNAEKLRKITLERAEKFISKSEWTDVNLTSKIYGATSSDSVHLRVWSVPNTKPNHTDKVSYAEMLQQPDDAFVEARLGQTFGPEWSTHWVKGSFFSLVFCALLTI